MQYIDSNTINKDSDDMGQANPMSLYTAALVHQ